MDAPLYIGLMSGTSMDGVDAVLACFDQSGTPSVLSRAQAPIPALLRHELMALNQPVDNELHRAYMAANALTRVYADAVHDVLKQSGCSHHQVAAIGAHGQTVRHQPALGYTIQLNAPALLAELTEIDVVADFRSRDVAAGGQGAPLVPIFHQAAFGSEDQARVVLNLGGIANITVLRPGETPQGCDTGPANMLLDMWCQAHTGEPYDKNGDWSLSGDPLPDLLTHLIDTEPWFAQSAPKSTGRDLFHMEWLQSRLQSHAQAHIRGKEHRAQDVQATLRLLTARTIASCIDDLAPEATEVIACGGGVRNPVLMREIAAALPGRQLLTTGDVGIDPQDVEALAFAWLAWAHQQKTAGNIPAVTGASGPRVLGALWPASVRSKG